MVLAEVSRQYVPDLLGDQNAAAFRGDETLVAAQDVIVEAAGAPPVGVVNVKELAKVSVEAAVQPVEGRLHVGGANDVAVMVVMVMVMTVAVVLHDCVSVRFGALERPAVAHVTVGHLRRGARRTV